MKSFCNRPIRFDTSEERIRDHEDRSKKLLIEILVKQEQEKKQKDIF